MVLILQIVYSRLILYLVVYFQSTITFLVYYFYSSRDLFIHLFVYLILLFLLLLFQLFIIIILFIYLFFPLFTYNLELVHEKCLFKVEGRGAGAKCRLCLKWAIGTPDNGVVLMFLLLFLNIFYAYYGASAVAFST